MREFFVIGDPQVTAEALRANPRRVQYIGINVRAHQLATFVVSGAFAGLAGGLFALSTGNVFPGWLNWTASATPIVMAVLGGVHTFLGPALGAAVYVVLEVLISGRTEYWPFALVPPDGHCLRAGPPGLVLVRICWPPSISKAPVRRL